MTSREDKVIAVLRGDPALKRAKRKGIEMVVYLSEGTYTIQVNNKTLTTAPGDAAAARADADARAARMEDLTGKTVTVTIY
jgi:uncharacterized cupin superfamily protein